MVSLGGPAPPLAWLVTADTVAVGGVLVAGRLAACTVESAVLVAAE